MGRGSSEQSSTEEASVGLLCGISAWHVRVLCDSPEEGGHGYTPDQVGSMTLDQIIMLMVDRKNLLNRKSTISPMNAASLAGPDGKIKGRASDGSAIAGRVGGKSKARMLMEKHQAKAKPRKKRHGN